MNTTYYSHGIVSVAGVPMFLNTPLRGFEGPKIVKVQGEIALINMKLGKLQLDADSSRNKQDPTEYRVNQNQTCVTDTTDKIFLKLYDLKVGQHVRIEFDDIEEKWMQAPIAQKITIDSMAAAIA